MRGGGRCRRWKTRSGPHHRKRTSRARKLATGACSIGRHTVGARCRAHGVDNTGSDSIALALEMQQRPADSRRVARRAPCGPWREDARRDRRGSQLDERPTLDETTVEWRGTRLAVWPGALIVVTTIAILDASRTRISRIDRGKVYVRGGDYAEFVLIQAERLAAEGEASTSAARSSCSHRSNGSAAATPARNTKAKRARFRLTPR